jgi:hypothetical protein
MTGRYAAQTEVSADRSRAEIERTLERYGADQFMYGWSGQHALVAFRLRGRHVRIQVPLPARDDPRFTSYQQGSVLYRRTEAAVQKLYEQATRQRWRALALVIKAKLEAVDVGISTVEDEFLAYTVTPDGSTVSQWLQPQLAEAYATGRMPSLLPALPAPRDGAAPR